MFWILELEESRRRELDLIRLQFHPLTNTSLVNDMIHLQSLFYLIHCFEMCLIRHLHCCYLILFSITDMETFGSWTLTANK